MKQIYSSNKARVRKIFKSAKSEKFASIGIYYCHLQITACDCFVHYELR